MNYQNYKGVRFFRNLSRIPKKSIENLMVFKNMSFPLIQRFLYPRCIPGKEEFLLVLCFCGVAKCVTYFCGNSFLSLSLSLSFSFFFSFFFCLEKIIVGLMEF